MGTFTQVMKLCTLSASAHIKQVHVRLNVYFDQYWYVNKSLLNLCIIQSVLASSGDFYKTAW